MIKVVKWFEVRDRATMIPVFAIAIEGDTFLERRAGFGGTRCIQLVDPQGRKTAYDPYDWANRTLTTAHRYIEMNWDTLLDHDVIDVEFILGESKASKVSESFKE
jgi:hypothetical protein